MAVSLNRDGEDNGAVVHDLETRARSPCDPLSRLSQNVIILFTMGACDNVCTRITSVACSLTLDKNPGTIDLNYINRRSVCAKICGIPRKRAKSIAQKVMR